MRILIALAALAITAACTPSPAPSEPAPTPAPVTSSETPSTAPEQIVATDEASCKTQGGDWRPVCRMQKPACITTFPDAGKACTDGSQCAGDCVASPDAGFADGSAAATGICAANNDPCGCKQKIEDGKATAAICVD
ncbi:MAG TPA: hypothetical protein PLH23_11120 [Hyphomonadaceae bacterium]|nr:hypothetical protein [Hyphomonadaceae bacterium]HPI48812.1 hypothetical protein [Hyphomonadaceae bacterium]